MSTITRTINYQTNSTQDLTYTVLRNFTPVEIGTAPIPQGTFTTTIDTVNNYDLTFFAGGTQSFNSVNILASNAYGDANVKSNLIPGVAPPALVTYYNPITLVLDLSTIDIERFGFVPVIIGGTAVSSQQTFTITEPSPNGIYTFDIPLSDQNIINNPTGVTLTARVGINGLETVIFTGLPTNQVYGPFTTILAETRPLSPVGFFQIDRNVVNSTGENTGLTVVSANVNVFSTPGNFIGQAILPSNLRFRPTLLDNIPLVPGVFVSVTAVLSNGVGISTPLVLLQNINNCFNITQNTSSNYILSAINCNQGPMTLRPSVTEKQVTVIGREC